MNALLSAASGKFAKSLVLGTLLPVTLVAVAFLWIVDPTMPGAGRVPRAIQVLDKEWQVVLFGFVVTAFAGILYNVNGTLLRFYSGYPWSDVWFGKPLMSRVRARWEPTRLTRDRQRRLERAAEGVVASPSATPALREALEATAANRTRLSRIVNDDYPFGSGVLLPTRLGNVIRNMEDYSRERYGITAVLLWPRLMKLIDASYSGYLDDAKTAVDFTLNLSLLCALASAATLWLLLRAAFGGVLAALMPLAVKTALFVILSIVFYRATIARAAEWNKLMRSAIDLFRLKLLNELGYEQKPKSREAEQKIWKGLARELSFADAEAPWMPYVDAAPSPTPQSSATALVDGARVGVLRGVEQMPVPHRFPNALVVLAVENTGTVPTDVRLTEVMPASWAFVIGSVTDSGNAFVVRTATPLTIVLSGLAPGTRRDVSYRIQSLVP